MPSVVHVVVTDKFAGVERYVASAARELVRRGWDVSIVGGSQATMAGAAGEDVHWAPGATALDALRSVARIGRRDICHVHMTLAELVGVLSRPRHRAAIVSTRHFAAPRGSSPVVRTMAPLLARGLSRQIGASKFVADNVERRPDSIILNGVPSCQLRWSVSNRTVLVLQRLEPEKDTLTAIRAWQASRLVEEGWSMRIVGDGSQREMLERSVQSNRVDGVTFPGWSENVEEEFVSAGMLLAPGARDSVGLSVLEAMAAGIPVVACASGGHLETVGSLSGVPSFSPGDFEEAASALRALDDDGVREELSAAGRALVATNFSLASHVDSLLHEYSIALDRHGSRARGR